MVVVDSQKWALETRTTKAHFLAADKKKKKKDFLNLRSYPRFFIASERSILMVEIFDSEGPLPFY